MAYFSAPLVGAYFRPPAKALLQSLPALHPLELRPEPSNPYDPNAVAVWLDASTIPDEIVQDELQYTLPGMGQDVDSLLTQRWWQLGYIAKDRAAEVHEPIARFLQHANEAAECPDDILSGLSATLGFDGAGKPLVKFSI